MPRCLATLETLPVEGYTQQAQAALSGGGRFFPHRLGYMRRQLLVFRAQVARRMSMSGVQDKVSLRLVDGRLEPTDENGEYLLKPIPGAPLPAFTDDVPANEHVTMLIAGSVFGIEVPPNGLVRLADDELAYVVKRFDRRGDEKIPQEDFSQVMGISPQSHGPNYKYEATSYEEIGTALTLSQSDLEELFVRIVFNYAISNGDAHLKNFSVFRPEPTRPEAPSLTPAYDLVSTSVHIPDESRLAMPLFKDDYETTFKQRYGFETGACFVALATRYGIPQTRARELLAPFLDDRAEAAVHDLVTRSFLSPAAKIEYMRRYRDRKNALGIGV
jgi:serine/threonine-protein kinase HipA